MTKYEYVSVKLNGPLTLKSEPHREIIDRYVGYVPTNFGPNVRIIHIDLILEIAY